MDEVKSFLFEGVDWDVSRMNKERVVFIHRIGFYLAVIVLVNSDSVGGIVSSSKLDLMLDKKR
jgi:hypothetical protein